MARRGDPGAEPAHLTHLPGFRRKSGASGGDKDRARCWLPVQTRLAPRLVSSGKHSPQQPAPVRALACLPTPGPSLEPGATGRGRKTPQAESQKQTLALLWGLVPERCQRCRRQAEEVKGLQAARTPDGELSAASRICCLFRALHGKPRNVK